MKRPAHKSNGRIHEPKSSPLSTDDNLELAAPLRQVATLKIASTDLRTIINTIPVAMLLIDSRRRIQMANESFHALFKIEPGQLEGKLLAELAGTQWSIPTLATILETVLIQGKPIRDFEIEQNFPRVGHKNLNLH